MLELTLQVSYDSIIILSILAISGMDKKYKLDQFYTEKDTLELVATYAYGKGLAPLTRETARRPDGQMAPGPGQMPPNQRGIQSPQLGQPNQMAPPPGAIKTEPRGVPQHHPYQRK